MTIKTFLKQEFLKQIRCYHKYSNTKKNKFQSSQILLAQLEKKMLHKLHDNCNILIGEILNDSNE